MNPYTLPELRAAILETHSAFETYLRGLPLEVFLNSVQGTWSPWQHAQHVMMGENALAGALTSRKLRLLEVPAVSRSYGAVVDAYRTALANTEIVNNPLSPPPYAALDALEATRAFALSEWRSSGEALSKSLDGYSDAELDALQGRHPLLGWLSLRELLMFMVYHVAHHQRALEARLAQP
jgi:hypothetical protein